MSTDQLPDRDPTKTNAEQGLYGKFRIERTDGTSSPGCKHHGCDYFVLDVTHDKHAAAALAAYAGAVAATHPQLAADMRSRWNLPAQPAGDAALPVVAHKVTGPRGDLIGIFESGVIAAMMVSKTSAEVGPASQTPLVSQPEYQAAVAALHARLSSMRCALIEIESELADRDARISGLRTEWAAEVAALQAEGAKSERRAIEFGDALHRHILAMRAAFVAWHRAGPAEGMAWVINTLAGPGHLPSETDIALGAQALFDKEVAEHESFRAAHPGPAPATSKPAGADAKALREAVQLLDMLAASEHAESSGEEP